MDQTFATLVHAEHGLASILLKQTLHTEEYE